MDTPGTARSRRPSTSGRTNLRTTDVNSFPKNTIQLSIIPEKEKKRRNILRPQTCPDSWFEKLNTLDILDKSSFHEPSDRERRDYTKKFIDRNRDILWKLDNRYLNKTPRTVYKDIVEDYYAKDKITRLYYKELSYKNKNSQPVEDCLCDTFLKSSPVKPAGM